VLLWQERNRKGGRERWGSTVDDAAAAADDDDDDGGIRYDTAPRGLTLAPPPRRRCGTPTARRNPARRSDGRILSRLGPTIPKGGQRGRGKEAHHDVCRLERNVR
jgi:hypothetical protein